MRRDSAIPSPPSPFPLPPYGFTLIEMLVVVSIVMILTLAAVTRMQPAAESRRIREAARALNVYFSTARSRAMETGRPCGVMLRTFRKADGTVVTPPFMMIADQCEIPPCYCGDTDQSVATVINNGSTLTVTLPNDAPANLLKQGDTVQFGCQGPSYSIDQSTPVDSKSRFVIATGTTWTLTCDVPTGLVVPWTAVGQSVPYRVFRSPVKSAATSLQLPAGSVIDMDASGIDTVTSFDPAGGPGDVVILFSPNGSVYQVWINSAGYGAGGSPLVSQPIFILVGKRERVGNAAQTSQTSGNRPLWANWQDLDNVWVVINPQTGLVTTNDVTIVSTNPSSQDYVASTDPSFAAKGLSVSRRLARDAQSMGGK
jgi:prepilin-type N-terminal cleavage/methylation domain-containing protein